MLKLQGLKMTSKKIALPLDRHGGGVGAAEFVPLEKCLVIFLDGSIETAVCEPKLVTNYDSTGDDTNMHYLENSEAQTSVVIV